MHRKLHHFQCINKLQKTVPMLAHRNGNPRFLKMIHLQLINIVSSPGAARKRNLCSRWLYFLYSKGGDIYGKTQKIPKTPERFR